MRRIIHGHLLETYLLQLGKISAAFEAARIHELVQTERTVWTGLPIAFHRALYLLPSR